LLETKRAELDSINEHRILSLETMLRERETKYHTLNTAYNTLKNDFVYNLKLIDDRDQELERFDGAFMQLKRVVGDKDNEKLEILAELGDARELLNREAERVHEKTSAVEGKIVEQQNKIVEQQEQIALCKMAEHQTMNRALAAENKVQEIVESYAAEIREVDERHKHFLEQMMQRHSQETQAHSVEMKEAFGREKGVQSSLAQQDTHVEMLGKKLRETEEKMESTRKAAKMYRLKVQDMVGVVQKQAQGFEEKRRAMERKYKAKIGNISQTVADLTSQLVESEQGYETLDFQRKQLELEVKVHGDRESERERELLERITELQANVWHLHQQSVNESGRRDVVQPTANEETAKKVQGWLTQMAEMQQQQVYEVQTPTPYHASHRAVPPQHSSMAVSASLAQEASVSSSPAAFDSSAVASSTRRPSLGFAEGGSAMPSPITSKGQ
jgi:chromosome segregation ATPase